MTPLDTLKAGIKTAVMTFIVGIVGVLTGLLTALSRWADSSGPAPDLGYLKASAIVLLGALATGVLNTAARYVQVAAVPFLGALVDRILGAVPSYPEPGEAKYVTSTVSTHLDPTDRTVRQAVRAAARSGVVRRR